MSSPSRPNVLYLMCDQFRYDCIQALGNEEIRTPNLDRLVRRGVSFTNAYSSCPVCVPARYVIRTGCEPATTGNYQNGPFDLDEGQPEDIEERCGPFIGRRMTQLGYRTFGIGKFHSQHHDLGYQTLLRAEEMGRHHNAYRDYIHREHPEYAWVEQLHGERSEMYYQPQTRPLPAELAYEAWACDRAVEQVRAGGDRPFFGFVSLIGPHPPIAPPLPYNRMYNPDHLPDPVLGDPEQDHADEQIPWMNYGVWAENVTPEHARVLKSRYYGTISYIDRCLGRVLDAVEALPDGGRNTLICFFADHGDHLGDHRAWQKESFFEASCRVPFLLSWPEGGLAADSRSTDLVGLVDLVAIATGAAGELEVREGHDVLGMLRQDVLPRPNYLGVYGEPGTPLFKVMLRAGEWKYVYLANGARELLFNLAEDPHETHQSLFEQPKIADVLRRTATQALDRPGTRRALEHGRLKRFPFQARPLRRIVQMAGEYGVQGFPADPADLLAQLDAPAGQ